MNARKRTSLAAMTIVSLVFISAVGTINWDGGIYLRLGTNLLARTIARSKGKDLTSVLRVDALEP